MFVLSSDFQKIPYIIPNLSQDSDLEAAFEEFYEEQEQAILKKLLGKAFYDELEEAYQAFTVWSATTTYASNAEVIYNRRLWRSLQASNLNKTPGSEPLWWEDVTNEDEWAKFIFGADYTYSSVVYEWVGLHKMLIPYIYQLWLRQTYDNSTDVGIVVADNENASMISPAFRISKAFNEFSRIAGGDFIMEDSMYGFLSVNEEDYPEFQYKFQGYINSWGL